MSAGLMNVAVADVEGMSCLATSTTAFLVISEGFVSPSSYGNVQPQVLEITRLGYRIGTGMCIPDFFVSSFRVLLKG